jgi:hypothetical protein
MRIRKNPAQPIVVEIMSPLTIGNARNLSWRKVHMDCGGLSPLF